MGKPVPKHNDFSIELDYLVEVLKYYGNKSFPFKGHIQSNKEFQEWANHLIKGDTHPVIQEKSHYSLAERDLSGSVEFFKQFRNDEVEWVDQNITTQKNLMVNLIAELESLMSYDESSNQQILSHLNHLSNCTSIDEIQNEVTKTIRSFINIQKERDLKNKSMLSKLKKHSEELENELKLVIEESSIDPLTKVLTRGAFDNKLNDIFEVCKTHKSTAFFFFVDVDNFKTVNDSFGHQAGDEALQKIADVLSKEITSSGDVVARYGGDEFSCVVQNLNKDEVEMIAKEIVKQVNLIKLSDNNHQLSVSIGITEVAPSDTLKTWQGRADKAVYLSKEAGKNTFTFLED